MNNDTTAPQGAITPSDEDLLTEWDRVSHITEAGQRRVACLRAALARWGAPQADELDIRGLLAELKCWHRLNGPEADELVAFFSRCGAPQP